MSEKENSSEEDIKTAATMAKPGGRTIKFTSDDDGTDFEFAWPQNMHISKFTRESASNGLKAHHNLVISLAMRPTPAELLRLFELKPGRPIALGNEICKATGMIEEFTTKN